MLSLSDLFNKLNSKQGKEEILEEFNAIDLSNSKNSDDFFEKYGGGNYILNRENLPYCQRDYVGRIDVYLDLFDLLKNKSSKKFYQIHKGTPYCLLGWLFLDIGDFEQGLFYIDAAMSEDVRIDPINWQNRPATQFLFLEQPQKSSPIGTRIVDSVDRYIEQEIVEYQKESNKKTDAKEFMKKFKDKFVRYNFESFTHRTLISALYVFLLEAQYCKLLLKRRSLTGGSIEPFLSSLHKGSLLFESLLKDVYTSHSNSTLGKIFHDPFVLRDLNFKQPNLGNVGQTLDDMVRHILPYLEKTYKTEKHVQYFAVSIRLRNITSHSLLLPDIFDESIYQKLYRQILFSSLYLIENKYFSR